MSKARNSQYNNPTRWLHGQRVERTVIMIEGIQVLHRTLHWTVTTRGAAEVTSRAPTGLGLKIDYFKNYTTQNYYIFK